MGNEQNLSKKHARIISSVNLSSSSQQTALSEILQTLRSGEQTKDFQLQERALERFQ